VVTDDEEKRDSAACNKESRQRTQLLTPRAGPRRILVLGGKAYDYRAETAIVNGGFIHTKYSRSGDELFATKHQSIDFQRSWNGITSLALLNPMTMDEDLRPQAQPRAKINPLRFLITPSLCLNFVALRSL
jgi:hypothetical protein